MSPLAIILQLTVAPRHLTPVKGGSDRIMNREVCENLPLFREMSELGEGDDKGCGSENPLKAKFGGREKWDENSAQNATVPESPSSKNQPASKFWTQGTATVKKGTACETGTDGNKKGGR